MNQENKIIEIGDAENLLAEGRLRAQRDQLPMMEGLKRVISEKLKTLETDKES